MLEKVKLFLSFVRSLFPQKQVKILNSLCLKFYKGNQITYLQGTNFRQFRLPSYVKIGVPKGKYFIANVSNTSITLIADGYGALLDNEFCLKGIYGKGPLIILTKNLPVDVKRFFYSLQHKKLRGRE
jgi:hypothetical protein